LQTKFGESLAKLSVNAVGSVGQNDASVQVGRNRRADLI
jgi:hypothetical protein